jgi:hypothetical protein
MYLKRDVTTVRCWEKREGMPVHRRVHDKIGSVYAFRAELDSWMHSRNLQAETVNEDVGLLPGPAARPPQPTASTYRP